MFIALLGGLLVGLLIGALGGGGAILSIPLLVYALGFTAQEATASSLIVVAAGALTGIIAQQRQGNIEFQRGALFGILGLLGSFIASRIVTNVNENLLLTLFAALLVLVATTMLLKLRKKKQSQSPRYLQNKSNHRFVPLLLTATAVGFLTGFFGVGGGFVIVPALTLVLGFAMEVAIGTSLVVILINSLSAMAFRSENLVNIDWSVVGPFALASVVGALVGSLLMRRIPRNILQLIFALFLIAIAVFMGAQNIPSLIN